jgi:hypothetical protein
MAPWPGRRRAGAGVRADLSWKATSKTRAGRRASRNSLGQRAGSSDNGNRYWAFQWTETAIFLAIAAALAGFSIWWIRHRQIVLWDPGIQERAVRWSVGIEAEAGAVLTREQVVELADAVAASGGVASGIGTSRYGARLIVQAGSREEAVAKATEEFTRAAATAGLPPGPVVWTEAVGEDEDVEGHQ